MLNHVLTFIIFLLIGVEIREGLSHIKTALVPIFAAIGGMLFPALIFLSLQPGAKFWAIVMPTDVALTLLVVALLKGRVSASTKLFLMTLAVADDAFSLLVIGVFYRSDLDVASAFYTLGAAGIGALIPLLNRYKSYLTKLTEFLVLPLYLILNLIIGFSFTADNLGLPLNIVVARFIGKIVGIALFSWIVVRVTSLKLPEGMKFSDVFGVGILCGMGLAVSLVIAEIVGVSADELQGIKSGLIAVILTSAIVGYLWFIRFPAEQYRLAKEASNR